MLVIAPDDPLRRGWAAGGEIARLAACCVRLCVNDPDVAARDALIAHEATDEGDGLAVGRPAGKCDLQAVEGAGDIGRGEEYGGFGIPDAAGLGIEFRDPPIVFTGRVGSDVGEGRGVGGPVEFIDVKVGGREEDRRGGLGREGGSNGGDALDFDAVFANDAGGCVHGGEGAGRTGGAFDIEEGDALAVG